MSNRKATCGNSKTIDRDLPQTPEHVRNINAIADLKDRVLAVIASYSDGERDFRRLNLNSAKQNVLVLSNAKLDKADFRGGHFTHADFRSAHLAGASLERANLHYADFSSAYLVGAHFFDADLSSASLNGADLTDADLQRADLSRADFRKARLVRARLEGADLRAAVLRGADLSAADLHGAALANADFTSANLDGANLEDVAASEHTLFPVAKKPNVILEDPVPKPSDRAPHDRRASNRKTRIQQPPLVHRRFVRSPESIASKTPSAVAVTRVPIVSADLPTRTVIGISTTELTIRILAEAPPDRDELTASVDGAVAIRIISTALADPGRAPLASQRSCTIVLIVGLLDGLNGRLTTAIRSICHYNGLAAVFLPLEPLPVHVSTRVVDALARISRLVLVATPASSSGIWKLTPVVPNLTFLPILPLVRFGSLEKLTVWLNRYHKRPNREAEFGVHGPLLQMRTMLPSLDGKMEELRA